MKDTGQLITDGFIALDGNWRILDVNRPAEERFFISKSREDLLGRYFLAECSDLMASVFEKHFRKAQANRVALQFDGFCPSRQAWYHVRVIPADDRLNLYLFECREAPEKSGLEAILSEIMGQAVLAMEPDGTINYWNRCAERIYGWSAADVIGRKAGAIIGPVVPLSEGDPMMVRNSQGQTSSGEFSVERRDGTILTANLTTSPVWDTTGRLIGLIGISSDVTSREELPKRNAFFSALVDSAEDAIISFSSDGRILTWNAGAEKLFGYPAGEAIGQSVALLTPTDRQQESDQCLRYVRRGESLRDFETVALTKLGHAIHVSLTASPLDLEGRLVGASWIVRDISGRKRMNDTLQGQISAHATALLSKQQQLRSLASALYRTDQRQRRQIASELHDNLAQILALCKLKLGKLSQNFARDRSVGQFDELNRLLDEAVNFTRTLLSGLYPMLFGDKDDLLVALACVAKRMEGLGLHIAIETVGEPTHLDEEIVSLTYQSVHELLSNTLRHANTTNASIHVRWGEERIEAHVLDCGSGFDVASVHARARDGCFGLFHIRQRLELFGGRLEITSTPNTGTCAKVILPVTVKPDSVVMDETEI